MKKIASILALLSFLALPCAAQEVVTALRHPTSGGGGIAVTCATGAGSFSGTSATLTISAPNGSLVVVGVGTQLTANFTSLKDNLGNNLTADTSSWIGATNPGFAKMFHEVSTGITSITATFAAGTNEISVEGCYVTGLTNNAADVIDQTGHVVTGGSTVLTTGAMTTTNAADAIFGFVHDGNNVTTFGATSPWVLGDTHSTSSSYSAGIIYQIVAATGTYTPTGTLSPSQAYSAVGGSYK